MHRGISRLASRKVVTRGPLLTFDLHKCCCCAARQTGHSLRVQYQGMVELTVCGT